MPLSQVSVSGRKMEVTDAIRQYVLDKLGKYEKIFSSAVSIEVECINNASARGVKKDFKVEILMHLPRTDVRVEKSGPNLYALIDEATDVVVRKVKRYKGKRREWEGAAPWKFEEVAEPDTEIGSVDPYVVDYIPRIVRRKKVENCSPVSEAEAIERMEMLGHDAFLFKNKSNGKFCMIYRRKKGGYGLVEPCE